MKYLCVHSDDIGGAYDIAENFCNKCRNLTEDPEIMYKIQTYNQPGGRVMRKSYLTTIKIGA